MKFRQRRLSESAEVDMTPMLDIVFIMLIFFIVTAVFLDERGIDLTEPPVPPVTEDQLQSISVRLGADDLADVDGQKLGIAAVPAQVEALRAGKPTATVIVSADPDASLGALVYLKDQFDGSSVPVSIRVDRTG